MDLVISFVHIFRSTRCQLILFSKEPCTKTVEFPFYPAPTLFQCGINILFHLHFLFISRIHEDHRRLHLSSNAEQGSHVFLWVAQAFWNQGGSRDAKEGGITLLATSALQKNRFCQQNAAPKNDKMTRCFFLSSLAKAFSVCFASAFSSVPTSMDAVPVARLNWQCQTHQSWRRRSEGEGEILEGEVSWSILNS